MTSGISKIIHQTSGARELPSVVRQRIASLRALHPGWDYRYYDDAGIASYIRQHYPQYFSIYQSINPKYGAARADLFRYLLMYREGGVYLDIKSTFTRPLDEALKPNDAFLLSHWNNGPGTRHELWGTYDEIANPRGEFRQCFMVCAPGHAFLAAVIEQVTANLTNYDVNRDGVGKRILHITGPIAYTLAITPLLDSHVYRLVDAEAELGFVYNFVNATGGSHQDLFDHHYSRLDEPVVLPSS